MTLLQRVLSMITLRRMFVAIFLMALFVLPVRETVDPDMWLHLASGEYILANWLPYVDVFSFTVAGVPWVDHEWLSRVIMALLYRMGGFSLLNLAFAGIIALSFWLVYKRCEGRSFMAAFVVLLAAVASAITWAARPNMFNLLGLAIFVYIVEGLKDRQFKWRVLWALPAITVVWANLHSGYLVGVVLLGTYTVGEALQLLLARRDARSLGWIGVRWLAIVTLACFLAAVLNPNTWRLWVYPFETLGSSVMQTYIQEWQSPDFKLVYVWPFGMLLVLGFMSWVFSGRRPTWTEALLFLGTGAAGLIAGRNISIFTIVATPIVARHLWQALANTWPRRIFERAAGMVNPAVPLAIGHVAILSVMFFLGAVRVADVLIKNDEAIAGRYPIAAVDYLEETGLSTQHGYNSYNWGGYLLWRGLPVFVDGRADVYGDEFLLYYLQAFQVQSGWQAPLDDYNVKYVLMEHDSPLNTLLAEHSGWQQAYEDDLAQIYTRVRE